LGLKLLCSPGDYADVFRHYRKRYQFAISAAAGYTYNRRSNNNQRQDTRLQNLHAHLSLSILPDIETGLYCKSFLTQSKAFSLAHILDRI
jgi:hypothetical protein